MWIPSNITSIALGAGSFFGLHFNRKNKKQTTENRQKENDEFVSHVHYIKKKEIEKQTEEPQGYTIQEQEAQSVQMDNQSGNKEPMPTPASYQYDFSKLSMDEKMKLLINEQVEFDKNTIAVCDIIEKSITMAVVSKRLLQNLLTIDGNENLTVNVDFNWTAQAIANLLKNSMEHTKLNGAIEISFGVRQDEIVLYLKDNGEGILSMDLPRVCDIYYTGKGVNGDHKGIGLTMAREIMCRQGGNLEVASKYSQGTCIKITFPSK